MADQTTVRVALARVRAAAGPPDAFPDEDATFRVGDIQTLLAEIERLREAAVTAALPLEAMILSGTWRQHSPDLQAGIKEGVRVVREVLADD